MPVVKQDLLIDMDGFERHHLSFTHKYGISVIFFWCRVL